MERLVPTLERSQVAWSLTANLWTDVPSSTGRADAALIRAASDVRTAIATTAFTSTGWATTAQLADRLDLNQAVATLQLGMAASLDIAYVMREVAAVSAGTMATSARGGARLSADRTQRSESASKTDWTAQGALVWCAVGSAGTGQAQQRSHH